VPGEDLMSIPGLQEVHQRALDRKLGITSFRALAGADQRTIYEALASTRPRASLTRIAAWQDDARNRLSDAATAENDETNWQTVVSFAVIFAQRRVGGVWERRLTAEQTEVEPALKPQKWPSWNCGPLCEWMVGHLELPAEDETGSEADAADLVSAATVTEPSVRTAPARASWAELRIDSATITGALQELELIRAGNLITAQPEDLAPPVRLSFTVTGGRAGQQLRAATWFRRRSGLGWSPQEPVSVPPSGRAEFDLSSVPAGEHDVRLLAWATTPGATLAAVSLPRLTFRPAAG
jgi:hypothetical protein